MYQDFFAMIIKNFFINLYTYLVFLKIYNLRKIGVLNKIIIIISTIICTGISALLDKKADNIFIIIVTFFVQLLSLTIITKRENESLLIGNLVSNAIVYIGFAICSVVEFPFKIFLNIEYYIIDFAFILLFLAFSINFSPTVLYIPPYYILF